MFKGTIGGIIGGIILWLLTTATDIVLRQPYPPQGHIGFNQSCNGGRCSVHNPLKTIPYLRIKDLDDGNSAGIEQLPGNADCRWAPSYGPTPPGVNIVINNK